MKSPIYLKYFASVTVWQIFNPFGILQNILQSGGQFIAILRSRSKIPKSAIPSITMSLPFDGYWYVINGGVDKSSSHSWNIIAQRYAYDFIFPEKEGATYEAGGRKARDLPSFGLDVLAPADGTVIKVQNNIRDFSYAKARTGVIDFLTRDIRGNYLIIRHAGDVYSLIAHLRRHSCRVKSGDVVKKGQVIGQCGNSGHSTEPHIHFQVQDHPNFYIAIGLPIQFKNIESEDNATNVSKKTKCGYISKNCKVRNLGTDDKLPDEPLDEIALGEVGLVPLITSAVNVFVFASWLLLISFLLIKLLF